MKIKTNAVKIKFIFSFLRGLAVQKLVNSQSKFHILKVKSIKAIIFFDLTKNVMAFLLKNCYDRTVFVGFSRKKDAETQK